MNTIILVVLLIMMGCVVTSQKASDERLKLLENRMTTIEKVVLYEYEFIK